jgi:hypothetical protein
MPWRCARWIGLAGRPRRDHLTDAVVTVDDRQRAAIDHQLRRGDRA